MESFHFYLPSNTSQSVYPQNNAGHYKVHLKHPLTLQGKWQVGVDSLSYDSNIGDDNEKANIHIHTKVQEVKQVKDNYPWSYKTLKDQWSYEWLKIPIKNLDEDIKNIIPTLNSINDVIGKKMVRFYKAGPDKVFFEGQSSSLTIRLNKDLGKYLGARENFLRIWEPLPISKEKPSLKISDMEFIIFDSNLVKVIDRVYFKRKGQPCPDILQVQKQWNEKLESHYGMKMEIKSNKCIFHKKRVANAMFLSGDFRFRLMHFYPLFGNGEFWPTTTMSLNAKHEIINESWYVDIYGTELATFKKPKYETLSYEFKLRHYPTVDDVMRHLNEKVSQLLKSKLDSNYDSVQHDFDLSMKKDYTAHMRIGHGLEIEMTKNLASMFSFNDVFFTGGEIQGTALARTLDKFEQKMFIEVDFIEEMDYGKSKRRILQDFVHDHDKVYGITEKRFYPISYVNVIKGYIDTIEVKITSQLDTPIKFGDSKSLLILHFRKVL